MAATVAQIQKLTEGGLRYHPLRGSDEGSGGCAWRDQEADYDSAWWQIFILTTGWQSRPWRTGADKIRINPGNIGSQERVQRGRRCGKGAEYPDPCGREQRFSGKGAGGKISWCDSRGHCGECLGSSVQIIEDMGYDNLVISIKSSDVSDVCKGPRAACRKDRSIRCMWGLQRPGHYYSGNIKSAIGLGIILYQGIGDTIRVSLTGDPVEEMQLGKD